MRNLKLISFILLILSPVGALTIWFWPNIVGQYRFQQYCAREGGLMIYGEVLPDQGWLAASSDPVEYRRPFILKRIAFVRYQDKQGKWSDVYIKRNPWPKDPDYIFEPVDESKHVTYVLKYTYERIPNELRLGKTIYEIYSIDEKKALVRHTRFGYSQFDQNKTFLNAPSGVICPDDDSLKVFFNIFK